MEKYKAQLAIWKKDHPDHENKSKKKGKKESIE